MAFRVESFDVPRFTRAVVERNRAASFVAAIRRDKFALADCPARGGIKHVTVRREATPRLRTASTFQSNERHTWRARTRQVGIIGSNQAGDVSLGPPSRFSRSTEGCGSGEDHTRGDHGGPQ